MSISENLRFLYLKQSANEIDISKALGLVDKEIIDSKKLNFYSSIINLEFFDHPTSSSFEQSDVNIGRFITGFEQSVFEKLSFKDYAQVSDIQLDVSLGDDWQGFFEELKSKIPTSLKKWKLMISEDFSDVKISFSS